MDGMTMTKHGLASLALFALALPLAFAKDAPSTGELKVHAVPGHAGVFVDGKCLGPAANFGSTRKYKVAAGDHELKISDPRYEDLTQKITITAGKTTNIEAKLKALEMPKPPYADLRVTGADKYAEVYLGGKYMGHAGEFNNPFQKLAIPPGNYDLKVVSPAGKAFEEKVTLTADKTTVVQVK
jgi:hypothetical protein